MANMALRAARQAGPIITRAMDRLDLLRVEQKARNDFVSNIDREAEQAIIDVLHRAYPDHEILGEESGHTNPNLNPKNEYKWIVDPLDGTTNYLQGIPHFCISIACMRGKQFEHGVIVDPLRNEEFVASRGSGAQLNGKRIRVSKTARLSEAVLTTGIPPTAIPQHRESYVATMDNFLKDCLAVRRLGSAALDLAYVAAGRFDGFWEFKLSPWDIAAGTLLVREAGGFVGDLSGGDSFFESGNIVAANPKCFKAMVQSIRPHLTPELASAG